MPENMPTLEKIETCRRMLDKLTDAQGRAKCGYIYIIDEFLNGIQSDVLVMEEKLKDKTEDVQNGGEIEGGN